jgi:hypothetical protein
VIFSFLTEFEKVNLQSLSKWMYNEGVANIQTRIMFGKSIYFSFTMQDADTCDIKEVKNPSHKVVLKRQSFSNEYWCSVQVGNDLFQVLEESRDVRWLKNLGDG